MVVDFYHRLFSREKDTILKFQLHGAFQLVSQGFLDNLLAPITNEKIKRAMFDIKPYEALRLNGYQSIFCQS